MNVVADAYDPTCVKHIPQRRANQGAVACPASESKSVYSFAAAATMLQDICVDAKDVANIWYKLLKKTKSQGVEGVWWYRAEAGWRPGM